ncbi:unnamed protein product, partial [marine sediment metagenome]
LEGTNPNPGTGNVFISRYDGSGTQQWGQQFTLNLSASGRAVSTDSFGNVVVTGDTTIQKTPFSNTDVFVRKYNSSGVDLWTRQLGTSYGDDAEDVSTDLLGNVYIAGTTKGNLGETGAENILSGAFLAKYNTSGVLQWTEQFGSTTGGAIGRSVATDLFGNVYIAGNTAGSLGGPNVGGIDVFLAKYDALGNQQWIEQFGSTNSDSNYDVSTDSLGNIYIGGGTGTGGFLAKYDATGELLLTEQFESAGVNSAIDSLDNI